MTNYENWKAELPRSCLVASSNTVLEHFSVRFQVFLLSKGNDTSKFIIFCFFWNFGNQLICCMKYFGGIKARIEFSTFSFWKEVSIKYIIFLFFSKHGCIHMENFPWWHQRRLLYTYISVLILLHTVFCFASSWAFCYWLYQYRMITVILYLQSFLIWSVFLFSLGEIYFIGLQAVYYGWELLRFIMSDTLLRTKVSSTKVWCAKMPMGSLPN